MSSSWNEIDNGIGIGITIQKVTLHLTEHTCWSSWFCLNNFKVHWNEYIKRLDWIGIEIKIRQQQAVSRLRQQVQNALEIKKTIVIETGKTKRLTGFKWSHVLVFFFSFINKKETVCAILFFI